MKNWKDRKTILAKIWHCLIFIFVNLYDAFLTEAKNGSDKRTFTSKKFFAFCFCSLALENHVGMILSPGSHWSIELTSALVGAGMSGDTIGTMLISMTASLDAFAMGALAVYGWAKVKGGI